MREFREFYYHLYNLPLLTSHRSAIEEYITASNLPALSHDIREELDSPITVLELQQALGAMKPGKAPGPDGFTTQYYRTLLPILGPRMIVLFNAIDSGSFFARDKPISLSSIKKEKTPRRAVATDLYRF